MGFFWGELMENPEIFGELEVRFIQPYQAKKVMNVLVATDP